MSIPLASATEGLQEFVRASRCAPKHPFRSLEPFRFADSGILAGRDREIERLVRLITMYRGVLLYGESGCGKSSVINAGVLPRMIDESFWPHRVRVQPRRGQEFALEPIKCSDQDHDVYLPSAFDGASEEGRLVLSADEFVAAVTSATERAPILLVFDQFEELVTLFPRTGEALGTQAGIVQTIVSLLRGGAIGEPGDPAPMVRVKLLFSFREDYLAGLKPLLEMQPELVHQGLRLIPPPQSAATEIITAPFQKFPGHFPREFSADLAEQIAASLAPRSEGEALLLSELQIVCSRLWDADDPSELLRRRGVKGLLEDHMEDALRQLPGKLRDAAVAVLSELITSSNTRNVVARPDLVLRAADDNERLDPDLIGNAIDLLETESGLIRPERRHDLVLYELTSEFLIPWISQQRDQASANRARLRQERRLRRQRLALAVIAAVLAGFIALTVQFLDQRDTARRQKAVATDLALASTAQRLLDIRPDASQILALAAYHDNPGLPAVKTSMIAALEQAQRAGAYGILHGFTNTVTSVAFDPVTGLLASGDGDGTIRLWDTTAHRQVGTMKAPANGALFSLAFSQDGRRLAAGGQDGTIRVWDVASRALAWQRPIHQPIVISVAFSPDGRWLAAAGLDAGIELVGLSNDEPVAPPVSFGGSTQVRSLAFSHDSRTLASAANDGTIRLWHVGPTPTPDLRTFRTRSSSALYTVAFNPRTDELAAGGRGGDVYLWDLASARPISMSSGTRSAINSVAFSPDGLTLAAGKSNDSIQLWDVTHRSPSGPPLIGHEGVVTSVAFSSDGRSLASGSTDRTIRLWTTPPPDNFGQTLGAGLGNVAWSVAFSGDGSKLAAAGSNGIQLWTSPANGFPSGPGRTLSPAHVRSVAFNPITGMLASGQGRRVRLWNGASTDGSPIGNSGNAVFSVAFSPDGRWLAFGGQRGTITLWDLAHNRALRQLPAGRVYSLAFSRDSHILASGGEDRTIRIWRLPDGAQTEQLTGDSDAVFSLAFSRNPNVLASGSADDTVRLWNIATGREIGQPLLGNHSYVRTVAFDSTGGLLASGSNDGTIRLWDVASQAQIGGVLSVNTAGIESLAFSPAGRYLVSAGDDGAVRTWPLFVLPSRYASLRASVCGRVWTGLSRSEWKQFAPDVPYDDPCR